MLIIGCDFHPRFQQIAYVDQESGEYGERRLNHPEDAGQFYRCLAGKPVRIGLEATVRMRGSPCIPVVAACSRKGDWTPRLPQLWREFEQVIMVQYRTEYMVDGT